MSCAELPQTGERHSRLGPLVLERHGPGESCEPQCREKRCGIERSPARGNRGRTQVAPAHATTERELERRSATGVLQVHMPQARTESSGEPLRTDTGHQSVAGVEADTEPRMTGERSEHLSRPCESLIPVILDAEHEPGRHAPLERAEELRHRAGDDDRRADDGGELEGGVRQAQVVVVVEAAGAHGSDRQAALGERSCSRVRSGTGVPDPELDSSKADAGEAIERVLERLATKRVRMPRAAHEADHTTDTFDTTYRNGLART